MKNALLIFLCVLACNSFAQSSFSLPGDGNWYKVASIGGQHGYLDYVYWHATPNNPSMTRGEIELINAQNFTVQRQQTMGYAAWNQPQFALLNLGSTSELWVKATNGVATGTFKINNSVGVTLYTGISDSNLTDNGGTLTTYDKLADNAHVFMGSVGIGTSAPSARLVVYDAGNTGGTGVVVGNPSTSSGNYTAMLLGTNADHNGFSYISSIKNSGSTFGDLIINQSGGNVGIGTTAPDVKLAVRGQVHAQEVKVDLLGAIAPPDYVFEKDYALPTLEQIKTYIDANKHLPEVPSAKEMEKDGVKLGEMNMVLLKKVEELTLYLLEQNKKIEAQQKQNEEQQKEIERLKEIVTKK